MTIALEQFVACVLDSQVLAKGEFSQFLKQLPSGTRFPNAASMANELVRQGKLTAYQAGELLQGRSRGLVMGAYVLLEVVGAGGMGRVFKAKDRRRNRIVALKVLLADMLRIPHALARFQKEIEACQRLDHANVVALLEAGQCQGKHYLAMEFVEGRHLGAVVKTCGPLPVSQCLDVILQAATGLDYAHRQGVIHRDVKPSNLLVDGHGRVKILDLGLARLVYAEGEKPTSSGGRLTHPDDILGTPEFMSPRQAFDPRQADERTDIYSLGCTLHFLLTGRPPYGGETPMEKILAHEDDPIPSLCAQRPDVPEALDEVFQKMLSKSPQDGYQSMSEVCSALTRCQSLIRSAADNGAEGSSAGQPSASLGEGQRADSKAAAEAETIDLRSEADTAADFTIADSPLPPRSGSRYAVAAVVIATLIVALLLLAALTQWL